MYMYMYMYLYMYMYMYVCVCMCVCECVYKVPRNFWMWSRVTIWHKKHYKL